MVGPGSSGVDVIGRDVTGVVDGSDIGVIGVLGGNGDGAMTLVPALVGLSTGGADVLERDVVVNRLVDGCGMEVTGGADVLEREVVVNKLVDDCEVEVLGVFSGVVDEDTIPPLVSLEVEETPIPLATPGPPPMQT